MELKVKELRETFLVTYKGKVDGTYHKDDIERVHKQDAFLRNVINSGPAGGDVEKAVALLDEILMFRVENKLNDLIESDLHPEIRSLQTLYYKGMDRKGNKLFHLKPTKAGDLKSLVSERQKLIMLRFFQHYRDHPENKITVLIDLLGCSPSQSNPELGKFLRNTANRYFPCMIESVLLFKMKPPLQAIYKVLKRKSDSKASANEIFVKRSNIQEYIDVSQLEPHMIKQSKTKGK